jgi:hypothetical protein
MNRARIDAALALGAAFFVLVSAMLFSAVETAAMVAVLLALLIVYTVARGHRWPG